MRSPTSKSSDPLPPPAIGGTPHTRRVYNAVDPLALAHVWAAAINMGYTADSARSSVLAFVALMREPYDG